MKDQLNAVIEKLGLSQKEFCQKVSISPSRLSEVLSGRTKNLSSDIITSIYRVYNINPIWLLTGEGSMFSDKAEMPASYKTQTFKSDLPETEPTRLQKQNDIIKALIDDSDLIDIIYPIIKRIK